MSETAEQLAEINQAITAILTGAQSYRIGTRSLTRASLNYLLQERQRLEFKLAGEQGSDISVAVFDRR